MIHLYSYPFLRSTLPLATVLPVHSESQYWSLWGTYLSELSPWKSSMVRLQLFLHSLISDAAFVT